MKPSYTFSDVMDAMAVWEEMLAVRGLQHEPSYTDALNDLWNDAGAGEMRGIAVEVSDRIAEAWEALANTPADPWNTMSYDWEFVPLILSLINWSAINLYREGYDLPDAGTLKARFLLRFDRALIG